MKMDLSRFLQSKFKMFIYTIFGWNVARMWVFIFGMLYFHFNKKERQGIENAVLESIGPEKEGRDARKLTKNVFKGIYSHYYEKLYIAYEKPEKAIRFMKRNIADKDLHKLRSILNRGRGVILVTGHYGAIEYIPTFLAAQGFHVSMIAKFKTPRLKRKVYAQAEKYGIRLIDGNKGGSVLGAVARELEENRVLITQCDEIEEWRPSKKETLTFLGRITGLDRTINVIQKRTGAEIIFGVIHRYHLDKYEMMMVDYPEILSRLLQSSRLSVGEAVLKFLERSIYANPEQWYQWKKYFTIGAGSLGIRAKRDLKLRYPVVMNTHLRSA
jgi:Kdo2-lipid IVA lauroyltransferase/acyltransferase